MNTSRRQFIQACAVSGFATVGFPAIVSAKSRDSGPILIGQTAAFTGGPAGTVRELTMGAMMYLSHVNEKGGIKGRTIQLMQKDDGFQADRAVLNATELLKAGVSALFLTRGTPTNEAILKKVKPDVPLIAPSTGAMSLRNPTLKNVFNVRSSYRLEGQRIVEDLLALAHTRLGVICINDSFGEDVLAGVLPQMAKGGVRPAFVERFDRNQMSFEALCAKAATNNPQSIVIIASTEPTVKIIKTLQAKSCTSMLATLSTNASQQFISMFGKGPDGASLARGIAVTQVMPKTRHIAVPLVAEATKRLEDFNKTANAATKLQILTPAMLEGFASAKVLVEGLRRAEDTTPDGLIESFESIRDWNMGWRPLSYSKTDHTGFDFAELSVINATGNFIY